MIRPRRPPRMANLEKKDHKNDNIEFQNVFSDKMGPNDMTM